MLTMKKNQLLKDFSYCVSISNTNGDSFQEIGRIRLGRAAMKGTENILRCKDVQLETKVKIIRIIVFPIIIYRCESR